MDLEAQVMTTSNVSLQSRGDITVPGPEAAVRWAAAHSPRKMPAGPARRLQLETFPFEYINKEARPGMCKMATGTCRQTATPQKRRVFSGFGSVATVRYSRIIAAGRCRAT